MTRVTLLGTGLMGAPMSRCLLRAGYDLTVWNRDPAKARPLGAEGATLAPTPREAVSDADLVITMLSDGAAVEDVLFGQGGGQLRTGAILVDCSSITPQIARRHHTRLAQDGIAHVDCPVSGGVTGASEGNLALMAGGTADSIARIAPVMAALGRLTHVGPSGAGQVCKLANQQIVAITIEALAEAMVLVEAGGADRSKFREAIRGGFAESRILELHGQRMVTRDFTAGGPSRLQLKDLDAVMELAQDHGLTLPLSEEVTRQFATFVANGHGEADHSGLLTHIEAINARQHAEDHP